MGKEIIPKIIHYCWFGRNPKSKLMIECLKSWRKFCPDYKIIEWNEDNFDINLNRYATEAYNSKKWAFVADYARLWIIYNHGGIYLDSDVELVKNIDPFLHNNSFSGFQDVVSIPTGIMGGIKGSLWFGELLDYYRDRKFIKKNGQPDLNTNVNIITRISKKYGLRQNNKEQTLRCGTKIYPKNYFCPKSYFDGSMDITKNTYAIHHFAGSWIDEDTTKILNSPLAKLKKFGYFLAYDRTRLFYILKRKAKRLKERL